MRNLILACSVGASALVVCGCVSKKSHEPEPAGVQNLAAEPAVEIKTMPKAVRECRVVKSKTIVGRVGYDRESFVLNKGMTDGVSVSQKFVLCVRMDQKIVRLAPAAVQATEGRTSTLRLDLRNVPDEDGDLIVAEGNRAADDFRVNPAKFIAEHEVFAVVCKECSSCDDGKGELKAK